MAVKIDCWDKNIVSNYDSQNQLIDRTREPDSSEIAKADLTPYNFLANLIVTQIANFGRNMAESQTQWDLLRVVCALQRYRLKHAGFSEDLDTLVTGEFMKNIPHD
ncbi:hypothetical protein N8586_05755 [Verrucomicrobiales bacterium]|nr:hypothetical protein [Verrucomicrobiales bacterium]